MKKINILENAIAVFSPSWAWKRAMFRQGLEALSAYDAAARDRLQPWAVTSGPAEVTDGPDRDRLRGLARHLERNSDIAQSAIQAILRNVVGTGIKPQARIKQKNGEFNEKLNKKVEEAWKRFSEAKNCDISELSSFYEFTELALRRKVVDGEILVKLVSDKSKRIPLRLQGLEADAFANYLSLTKPDKYIISGVEVDQYYRPLGYWIQRTSPDGLTYLDPIRLPADEVLHLFLRTRLTQVRGISELAPVMRRMRETGEYLDAELVAARIAASYALFIKTQYPGEGMARLPKNSKNEPIESLEPGKIKYLQPGESIEAASPGRNATTAKDFIEIELRLAGAGLGMSYEEISRDMSKTNYSSARQNHLIDRKTWLPIQSYMIEHFCKPIWKEFIRACVLSGELDIPGYWSEPDMYHVADWIAPGWVWIDPLKDVKGSKEELMAGLDTLQRVCAERGLDWQETLEQMAREKKLADNLGLKLDIHYPVKSEKVNNKGEVEDA